LRRNSPLGGTRCFREASHLAKAPSVRREELSQVPWKFRSYFEGCLASQSIFAEFLQQTVVLLFCNS
jgi:hypothetical protein